MGALMTAHPASPLLRLLAVLSMVVGAVAMGLTREATSKQGATPTVDGVTVFQPDEPLYGAKLAEWSARHWQWTASFPVGANPGQDATGARCGYGQSGPVFFLPRNFPPCTVPAGVALFVPVAGGECSTVEPPHAGRDEAELRACAAAEADRYTGIVVRVDGHAVPEIQTYRASTPLFALMLPERNVLGVPAGVAPAVADGYQVMVAPLPAGEHEITVHVELTDGTVLPDKTARITVVALPAVGPAASPGPGTPLASPLAAPVATPLAAPIA